MLNMTKNGLDTIDDVYHNMHVYGKAEVIAR